jgi:hypothetical protein
VSLVASNAGAWALADRSQRYFFAFLSPFLLLSSLSLVRPELIGVSRFRVSK